jgi:hypothetical protein
MRVLRHAWRDQAAQQPSQSAPTTVSSVTGSPGSTVPAGTAGHSRDPGSPEDYSRGTDPGDRSNADASYC